MGEVECKLLERNDTAYYLLFNEILGDKSHEIGSALTCSLLAELPAFDGKKIIFG